MPTEYVGGEGQRMAGGSLLDIPAMDGNPTQDACPRPQAHNEAEGCPVTTFVRGGPSHHAIHKIDGVSIVREHLRGQGISKEVANIILVSW